jgi:hypothetical protein
MRTPRWRSQFERLMAEGVEFKAKRPHFAFVRDE